MTETSTRSGRRGRLVRRVGALIAATGLLFTGVLMGGPAIAAAAAAEPEPIAVVQEVVPVMEDALIPIAEPTETTRPLALSVFVVSALTVGAGGIVTARLMAARKPQPAVVESRK
ncbi:hypothetical protein [Gryllotalpicola kribbensis]|uniref:hypothetical protein n=1 Tax=Gryllotalpicola kribbensis TaxID=993084 RepID=UPI0031D5D793